MSNREGSDDYDNVVARLGAQWRVIVCKDDLQWIMQERIGAQWRSKHYLTSREGVLRRAQGKPGWEALASLPAHFTQTGKDGRARRTQKRAAEASP